MADLWEMQNPITTYPQFEGVEVPAWIEQDISPYDVAAIVQGGCASGAYMPAVTYATAQEIMNEHGDDVLDYINDVDPGLLVIPGDVIEGTSWAGIAVYYLSVAVELWASDAESVMANAPVDGSE
jgi:hypothetical protein